MAKKKRCKPLDEYLEKERISPQELAGRLEIEESTARSLVNGNRPITAERAVQIETKLGIPREQLRPDIFIKQAA